MQKSLLLPLTLAGLLAMLFMPISRWFERKGIGRALASLLCVLLLIAILTAVIYFFIWQINAITQDVSAIQRNVMCKLHQLEMFLYQSFGITPSSQEEIIKGKNSDGLSSMISSLWALLFSLLTNFIIMLVYIFMLLLFKKALKDFYPETYP